MRRVRITVMRKVCHRDLMEKYENPIEHACDMKECMLLDYCIGRAASQIKEFYILPVGDKLIQYDTIAVNTIVKNKNNEVSSCDIR